MATYWILFPLTRQSWKLSQFLYHSAFTVFIYTTLDGFFFLINSPAIICPCAPFMHSDKATVSGYMNMKCQNWQITASSLLFFQAALGPVALDEVRKLHIQEYKAHGSTILIITVILILITLLVPRLLEKEDIIDYQHINMQCSVMQSSVTCSCPCLSYYRGMARPLGLSDPQAMGWYKEVHRSGF